MPVIDSKYKPANFLFRNTHLNTIYASLLRRVPKVKFERERIIVDDIDFLDLDWSASNRKKLVLILAGLEGKSQSLYSRAAIHHFNNQGWDCVCMNYRGCSGEPNRLLKGYHMGASADVKSTIDHILKNSDYKEISIIGYSLGGNLALKYAAEEGDNIPKKVKSIVAFSVPLDIKKSHEKLSKWYNWHYLKWFMFPLNVKANRKKKQFPGKVDNYNGFFMSGDFLYFDTHFTAPANGFSTVEDYWNKSSSKSLLHQIKIPSLIIASHDDSFISKNCIPFQEAKSNLFLNLEVSQYGGHCGFIRKFFEKTWWMEERALQFIKLHKNKTSKNQVEQTEFVSNEF